MAKSVFYTIEGKTYEVIREMDTNTRPALEMLIDYFLQKEKSKNREINEQESKEIKEEIKV